MNKFIKSLVGTIVVGFSLSAISNLAQAQGPVVKALTYDSLQEYGVTKAITPILEKECGCTIKWSTVKNQHLLLNTFRVNKDTNKANYDIIVGANINDSYQALKVNKALENKGKELAFAKVDFLTQINTDFEVTKWDNPYALPFTSSPIAVYVNTDKVSKIPTYKSWKEWIEKDEHSFIFANPQTNDIGRAISRIIAYYYPTPEEQLHAWTKIKNKTVTVGTGWSSSYLVFAKGESDEGAGYASSIIYHRLVENKNLNLKPMVFEEGTVSLVNTAIIANQSDVKYQALKIAQALLKNSTQKVLMMYNSDNPIVKLSANEINQEGLEILKELSQFKILPIDFSKPEPSLDAYQKAFTK